MAPGPMPGRAAARASSASCAQVSDTTTVAPRQASASPAHAVTPGPGRTCGSNPRTTAPAATRSAAISAPASPRPSTATTGAPPLIAAPPPAGPAAPRSRSADDHASPARRRPGRVPSPPRRSPHAAAATRLAGQAPGTARTGAGRSGRATGGAAWPSELSPQPTMEPSAFMTRLWKFPAAIARTLLNPAGTTDCPTKFPRASSLSPQATTVRLVSTARL